VHDEITEAVTVREPWQPSAISSWIKLGEALSSISTTLASNRFCCSRTARLSAVLEPPAEDGEQEEVLAFDPPRRAHAEITELGRLVGVSQLCTMWSKHSDRSFSR